MNDTAESKHSDKTMILAEVQSGKTCKLIGVVRKRRGRAHGQGRRHRAESGFFKEFRERWEEQKEEHHWGQWEDEEGYKPKFGYFGSQHMGGMRTLRRLLDLGITKGCSFVVVQGSTTGPVLLQVRGTRVAVGQGLASKMLVEVIDG